ncbi:MAG: AI-2E family transporter [Chitinispirillaceae bacterium]
MAEEEKKPKRKKTPGGKTPEEQKSAEFPRRQPSESRKPEAPSPKDLQPSDKLSRRVLIVMLAISIAVALPIILFPFVVPLVLALTFTTLFYPFYRWILRRIRYRRKTASILTCLLFLLLLLIPSFILVNLVVGEAIALYDTLEPTIQDIIERGSESEIIQYLRGLRIVQFLRLTEIDWLSVMQQAAQSASGVATTVINRTSAGVFGLFLNLFIMIFTMFYFFVDGQKIIGTARNLLPMRNEYEDMIIDRFTLISRATVTATLLIGLAQGVTGGLTLYIFGVDSWLLWAFIMVILSIIPLVGTWLVLIPAAVIQMILGNILSGLGILLSSTLIISNLDNFIRPRVVGYGSKVHDLLIFFATIGGLSYFGVMGFIIGPALASFVISLLDIYSKEFRSQIEAAK